MGVVCGSGKLKLIELYGNKIYVIGVIISIF